MIINNSIQGCEKGISLIKSTNNIISNNTILDLLEAGISLEDSGSNIITDNNLENCGLSVSGNPESTIEHYQQTEVSNNSVNGKPLVYWQHEIGRTVPSGVGQVILVDCTDITVSGQNMSYGSSGVQVAYSSNLLIDNNTISNNKGDGINLISSDYCNISHNLIFNNAIFGDHSQMGIAFYSSNYNIISENTIFNHSNSGIYLRFSCNNNNISGNIITNNSVSGISFSDLPHIIGAQHPKIPCNYNLIFNNTLKSNSKHGLNVGSCGYNTLLNNSISQNGRGGIKLDCSSNCVVSYNTITHNHGDGIESNAVNNVLSNNTIANNLGNGISSASSAHTFILGNIITNNTDNGIRVFYSSENITIINNVISNNTFYGVSIEEFNDPSDPPEFNYVSENIFFGNNPGGVSQAFDECPNNLFYFNYWNDWISQSQDTDNNGILDDPYPIEGSSNNLDFYPLFSMILPPRIEIFSPFDMIYNMDQIWLNFSIDQETEWIGYSLDGAINVTITDNISLISLSEGSHFIILYTNDSSGYMVSAGPVWFSIDTIPPLISITNPTPTTYITSDINLAFTVDEPTSWIGYSLDGSENVTITGNIQFTSLTEGTHSLIIYAADISGNIGVSEVIWFTISVPDDTSTTSNIISTTTSTTTKSITPGFLGIILILSLVIVAFKRSKNQRA